MKRVLFLATMMAVLSCSEGKTENQSADAYTMMETVFEGYPSKSEIQPLMQKVLQMYGYEETEENLQKVGSVLVELRKNSVLGVTEMDILKDVYQNGNTSITFAEQAAISAVILERKK